MYKEVDMTVKQAAKLMGVSEQFVRIGLQRNRLPIGTCVKISKRYSYYISPSLFEQFTGIKNPPAATDGQLAEQAERTRLV